MQEEEMLYQALRLKFWLERIQKDEWAVVVPEGPLKQMMADVGELVEQAKRGKGDSIRFFNAFFKTLDEIVLDSCYSLVHENRQIVDMINAESQVADILNQELAIYKKRFGEIPQKELDEEILRNIERQVSENSEICH